MQRRHHDDNRAEPPPTTPFPSNNTAAMPEGQQGHRLYVKYVAHNPTVEHISNSDHLPTDEDSLQHTNMTPFVGASTCRTSAPSTPPTQALRSLRSRALTTRRRHPSTWASASHTSTAARRRSEALRFGSFGARLRGRMVRDMQHLKTRSEERRWENIAANRSCNRQLGLGEGTVPAQPAIQVVRRHGAHHALPQRDMSARSTSRVCTA